MIALVSTGVTTRVLTRVSTGISTLCTRSASTSDSRETIVFRFRFSDVRFRVSPFGLQVSGFELHQSRRGSCPGCVSNPRCDPWDVSNTESRPCRSRPLRLRPAHVLYHTYHGTDVCDRLMRKEGCDYLILRILVYSVIYDSGWVSLEHVLLSRNPSQKSVEPTNPESITWLQAVTVL